VGIDVRMSPCSGCFTHCRKSEVTLSASRLWHVCHLFQFHIWVPLLVFLSTYANCLHDQTPSEQSRGCFGCCDKTVKQLGELSRNLITQDQITIGEPFWSTTTIEVEPADLSGVTSVNTSNLASGTGSSHNLPGLGNNGRSL
jgi:hypothetical protein